MKIEGQYEYSGNKIIFWVTLITFLAAFMFGRITLVHEERVEQAIEKAEVFHGR